MGCFFGCFRSKDKQHFPPPTAAVRKARVSQNPLSDLFVAREIEDFSSNEKTAPPEIVDRKCNDAIARREVDSSKRPDLLEIPAKHGLVQKGFDSLEGTPTSCICDPPNAGRILVSTTDMSESKNSTSTITHPYHTNEDNQIGSLQKHKNRPTSLQEDMKLEGSLSAWLKPVQQNKVGNRVNFEDDLGRTGSNPGDIPILGTVAAYWNDEVKPSEIPSKWWDGNGIPNSTTKYREDQKVSWHATPFEERLEKALSEEKSISQSRKHINRAHTAIENNEMDTAASQLQSFPHPQSVVSC